MPEDSYLPLDLTAFRNASASLLAYGEHAPALGSQHFHGLPFSVGEAPHAFVGLGDGLGSERVSIRVGRAVYCVVFAHRLLGSTIERGGPVGSPRAVAPLAAAKDHARPRVAARRCGRHLSL
jgi:hypothetical protein